MELNRKYLSSPNVSITKISYRNLKKKGLICKPSSQKLFLDHELNDNELLIILKKHFKAIHIPSNKYFGSKINLITKFFRSRPIFHAFSIGREEGNVQRFWDVPEEENFLDAALFSRSLRYCRLNSLGITIFENSFDFQKFNKNISKLNYIQNLQIADLRKTDTEVECRDLPQVIASYAIRLKQLNSFRLKLRLELGDENGEKQEEIDDLKLNLPNLKCFGIELESTRSGHLLSFLPNLYPKCDLERLEIRLNQLSYDFMSTTPVENLIRPVSDFQSLSYLQFELKSYPIPQKNDFIKLMQNIARLKKLKTLKLNFSIHIEGATTQFYEDEENKGKIFELMDEPNEDQIGIFNNLNEFELKIDEFLINPSFAKPLSKYLEELKNVSKVSLSFRNSLKNEDSMTFILNAISQLKSLDSFKLDMFGNIKDLMSLKVIDSIKNLENLTYLSLHLGRALSDDQTESFKASKPTDEIGSSEEEWDVDEDIDYQELKELKKPIVNPILDIEENREYKGLSLIVEEEYQEEEIRVYKELAKILRRQKNLEVLDLNFNNDERLKLEDWMDSLESIKNMKSLRVLKLSHFHYFAQPLPGYYSESYLDPFTKKLKNVILYDLKLLTKVELNFSYTTIEFELNEAARNHHFF